MVTAEQILQIIDENNLTIRKLPKEVISKWFYDEKRPRKLKDNQTLGDFIPIDELYPNATKRAKERLYNDFPRGRRMVTEISYPEHGGWYICKQIKDTRGISEKVYQKKNC